MLIVRPLAVGREHVEHWPDAAVIKVPVVTVTMVDTELPVIPSKAHHHTVTSHTQNAKCACSEFRNAIVLFSGERPMS